MYLDRIECNLEMVRKSLDNLLGSIRAFHEMKIYVAIGESLLWICVSDDWFKTNSRGYVKRRNEQEMTPIISGVRRAFNAFKHNMLLTKVHESRGGFEFTDGGGMEFPFEIPEITVHWAHIVDNDLKLAEKYKKQIENYAEYLEGKEVYLVLKNTYDFLFSELWVLKRAEQ